MWLSESIKKWGAVSFDASLDEVPNGSAEACLEVALVRRSHEEIPEAVFEIRARFGMTSAGAGRRMSGDLLELLGQVQAVYAKRWGLLFPKRETLLTRGPGRPNVLVQYQQEAFQVLRAMVAVARGWHEVAPRLGTDGNKLSVVTEAIESWLPQEGCEHLFRTHRSADGSGPAFSIDLVRRVGEAVGFDVDRRRLDPAPPIPRSQGEYHRLLAPIVAAELAKRHKRTKKTMLQHVVRPLLRRIASHR